MRGAVLNPIQDADPEIASGPREWGAAGSVALSDTNCRVHPRFRGAESVAHGGSSCVPPGSSPLAGPTWLFRRTSAPLTVRPRERGRWYSVLLSAMRRRFIPARAGPPFWASPVEVVHELHPRGRRVGVCGLYAPSPWEPCCGTRSALRNVRHAFQ